MFREILKHFLTGRTVDFGIYNYIPYRPTDISNIGGNRYGLIYYGLTRSK